MRAVQIFFMTLKSERKLFMRSELKFKIILNDLKLSSDFNFKIQMFTHDI